MGAPSVTKRETPTISAGMHVCSMNGIYKPLGVGVVQKVRDHQCKVEFNPTVFSRPPYRSENKILKLDEVVACPSPLELAGTGTWDEVWKLDLRQLAARYFALNKDRPLYNSPTETLPHHLLTTHPCEP